MVNACLLLLNPLLHRMRPKLGWASNNQSNQDYQLNNPSRDRPSKLLPVKYHARHTDGSHNFTRLKDNHQRLEIPGDSVLDGSSKGLHFSNQSTETREFAKQTKDGNIGQPLPVKGITVTKTINVESYSNL